MNTSHSAAERVRVIAELAYRFWEERGCPEGSPEEDWYKAELIIDRERNPEGETTATPRTLNKRKSNKRKRVKGALDI